MVPAMNFGFGHFVLSTEPVELTRSGSRVDLDRPALDLLVLLIENRNRDITRSDIVERVWQGRSVTDTEISNCVKSLRTALDDDDEQQRLIQAVPVGSYRFVGEIRELAKPAATAESPSRPELLAVPPTGQQGQGRPSIVVLPFDSLILEGPVRVLCEAVPHELIQALSRLRWIRVIARGTAFRFRAPNPDLEAIGRQLAVRYALCGMIERLGETLAITIELSDCESGAVVWADRFETRPEALHEVRHEIVSRVVSSMEIYIPLNEAEHAQMKAPSSLDAWSNYHLGLRHMFRFSRDDNDLATILFKRAIAQDPSFARAHAGLSFTRFQDAFLKYTKDVPTAIADARRYAERSIELDPLDPFSNLTMGRSFWLDGDPADGQSWLERSISLSPNFAQGYYSKAFTQSIQGNAAEAIENATRALDLSPLDPLLYAVYSVRALGLLRGGDVEKAAIEAEQAAHAPGAHFLVLMIAAVVCHLAGEEVRARHWSAAARRRRPDASKEQFFTAFPILGDDFRRRLTEALTHLGF